MTRILVITTLGLALLAGCGDDSDTDNPMTDGSSTTDMGSTSGAPNCTETFTFCGLDTTTQHRYETCFSPGNTSCWYRYEGTDYMCSDCSTATGCQSAAEQVISAICD